MTFIFFFFCRFYRTPEEAKDRAEATQQYTIKFNETVVRTIRYNTKYYYHEKNFNHRFIKKKQNFIKRTVH